MTDTNDTSEHSGEVIDDDQELNDTAPQYGHAYIKIKALLYFFIITPLLFVFITMIMLTLLQEGNDVIKIAVISPFLCILYCSFVWYYLIVETPHKSDKKITSFIFGYLQSSITLVFQIYVTGIIITILSLCVHKIGWSHIAAPLSSNHPFGQIFSTDVTNFIFSQNYACGRCPNISPSYKELIENIAMALSGSIGTAFAIYIFFKNRFELSLKSATVLKKYAFFCVFSNIVLLEIMDAVRRIGTFNDIHIFFYILLLCVIPSFFCSAFVINFAPLTPISKLEKTKAGRTSV